MNKPVQVPNHYLDTAETLERIVKRMDIDPEFTTRMITAVDIETFLKEQGYEINGAPLEVVKLSMKKIRTYITDQTVVLSKKVDEFVRGAHESGNGAGGWA
ncbi:TPA: hypothetical protein ROX98_001167 [Bacillus pseudomycoides]|nr:hypothetical protein [Bacillus pseudomycoides]